VNCDYYSNGVQSALCLTAHLFRTIKSQGENSGRLIDCEILLVLKCEMRHNLNLEVVSLVSRAVQKINLEFRVTGLNFGSEAKSTEPQIFNFVK
jgi:hypothetical protein